MAATLMREKKVVLSFILEKQYNVSCQLSVSDSFIQVQADEVFHSSVNYILFERNKAFSGKVIEHCLIKVQSG